MKYVKFLILNDLFPTSFPLETNGCLFDKESKRFLPNNMQVISRYLHYIDFEDWWLLSFLFRPFIFECIEYFNWGGVYCYRYNINIEDAYKPHGVKLERWALLREDIFDMLVISTPPSLLPWTTERETFLRQFFFLSLYLQINIVPLFRYWCIIIWGVNSAPRYPISFKPSETNTLSSLTFQMLRRLITHSNNSSSQGVT